MGLPNRIRDGFEWYLIGRRPIALAVAMFIAVSVAGAIVPSVLVVPNLALVVGWTLVVVAGYTRRSVVIALLLGTAPYLGILVGVSLRDAVVSGSIRPDYWLAVVSVERVALILAISFLLFGFGYVVSSLVGGIPLQANGSRQ
jgi:hypothetical protein